MWPLMAEEPDSLTLRLLQEMREEMRGLRQAQAETNEKIADWVQRIDGNTLTFNLVAGAVYDHEQRIAMLEERRFPRS